MNLKQQRAAALKAAQDIVAQAKADGRDLTDTEQTEVEAKTAEITDLDEKIEKAAKSADLIARIGSITPGSEAKSGDEPTPARSLGEHFAKSVGAEGFMNLKERGGYTVSAPEFKVATDPQATPAVFGVPVLTQVDQTIVQAYRRQSVADLMSSGTLSGNAISYFVEGAVEGAYTTVAEGAQKPQIHIADPTQVTDALKKIAAWFDTTDEMAEDLPFWVSEVNNRGLYLLSMFEEAQLLNGNGTGSNVLGLLNRSGIQTETAVTSSADNADALFRALTKVQTATGLVADSLVINPADYQKLRLTKDANGQYFGGGFFSGTYGQGGLTTQPPVWGLNTVVSAATAAGTAVVGALKPAATVYRKGGVRVESTNSDLGKFTKNIITTRIEERVALAVRNPSAVVKVTLL
ncbi:MAG: phage major capsid protein [Nocardioides sp.]|nr:phage major capsid protein [Nocardioides sp.]